LRRRKGCVYFNTSLLIRAVNPREIGHAETLRFINELVRRGYVLVYSNIHWFEGIRADTGAILRSLFSRFRFARCAVNVYEVLSFADKYVRRKGYSISRRFDIAHIYAAKLCGCRYIAAVDRFIWAHAREFGLKYINYYTGIP
jgi:hypothetical protein